MTTATDARYLDVHIELDPDHLAQQPDAMRTVAEISRRAAEQACANEGRTLRHPEPAHVHVTEKLKPRTAKAVLLIATRWVVD